ncbi:hypothetical protein ACFY19_15415 [Streptosporangium saharense]|uniref:hypothetical protein n=1 Tax=Streptosporangium saharense TaxID=1706840 RepID=UPI0036902415
MINSLLAAVLAGSMLTAPLKTALLTPDDLGAEFVRGDYRTDILRNSVFDQDRKCGAAVRKVSTVYRSRVATALKYGDRWEGVTEYIVRGTAREISALERAARAMARHCRTITAKTDASREIVRALPTDRLGDGTYGIKYRAGLSGSRLENDARMRGMMVAVDVVFVRVKNTAIVLEHNGNVGEFDPALTRSATRAAVSRLRQAL